MNRLQSFVQLAIEEANKSLMKTKYGSIIVHRNRVISKGYNYHTKISSLSKNNVLCF